MVAIITSKSEIRKVQDLLRKCFQENAKPTRNATIGYQSGQTNRDVYWHAKHKIWGSFNKIPPKPRAKKRFWNAFGIEDPEDHSDNLSIVCEVNPVHEGTYRYVAGFFAKDDSGRYLALHKGRLTRHRPGLTIEFFWKHYAGRPIEIDGITYAIVCTIGSSKMIAEIATFVDEVRRIKAK